ncbi:hypothetical protein KY363_06520, partial [Candidatus Woesearchaeota archaeon]|nr:hypothetical protein [Candidatus Woesearchaeota archaeon]
TCVLGQCGAECSGTNRTYDRCDGDLLNYSWTCSSNCTWQYRTTNCNNLDGWYGTDNTTWTAEDKCTENEQRVEEYRDYTCGTIIPCANCRGSPGCTYSVTDRRTAPTGNTREAQSRDCQPATAEENDCNSLRRCASEYNNNMENASDSIKSLVGNERINLVMGEGKDRVVCGAVANDARIGTLKAGGIDKPTINVFAEKTVLQSICKSPKPEEAFKAAMKSGEIKLRGAGAGNRAKMAVGRTVARILSRFTGSMFDVKKNEQKLIEYEGKKGVLMLNSMGQRIIQFLNSNVVIVIDKYGNKISQSSLAEQDLIGHGNMPALIDYPSRPTGLEIDGVVQTFSNVIQALTQTGMQTISGGISQMASSAQNNTQQMKSGCSLTGSISSCAQMQKQSAQDMQTIENTLKIQQQMLAMVNTIIQQQQQTISPISSTR